MAIEVVLPRLNSYNAFTSNFTDFPPFLIILEPSRLKNMKYRFSMSQLRYSSSICLFLQNHINKLRNLFFILRQKLHEFGGLHNWHAVNYTDIRPGKVESSIRLGTFCFVKDVIAVSGKINPLVDDIDSFRNLQLLKVFHDIIAVRRVPGTVLHQLDREII